MQPNLYGRQLVGEWAKGILSGEDRLYLYADQQIHKRMYTTQISTPSIQIQILLNYVQGRNPYHLTSSGNASVDRNDGFIFKLISEFHSVMHSESCCATNMYFLIPCSSSTHQRMYFQPRHRGSVRPFFHRSRNFQTGSIKVASVTWSCVSSLDLLL